MKIRYISSAIRFTFRISLVLLHFIVTVLFDFQQMDSFISRNSLSLSLSLSLSFSLLRLSLLLRNPFLTDYVLIVRYKMVSFTIEM